MLSNNRLPQDHFASSCLNTFYNTNNISKSIHSGAMSYLAISTSNSLANKDYKQALISSAGAMILNNFLGDKMNNNFNPYLNNNNNNQFGFNQNCPYNPYLNNNNNNNNNSFFNSRSNANNNGMFGSPFVKGLLVGAAVAYLLSNKEAKDSLAKGIAKIQSFASATLEEFKEQIEDAKASMQE